MLTEYMKGAYAVEFDYSKLRGRIVEKYHNVSKFADALGITRSRLNNILVNGYAFTVPRIVQMANLLDIDQENIGFYFFTPRV